VQRTGPIFELEHEARAAASAIEPPSSTAVPTVGCPGKRQLGGGRRENPDLRAVSPHRSAETEHRLRQIELARDRLHRGGVEPFRFEHYSERVSGETPVGEHIERNETAAHEAPLDWFRRRIRGSD
jgi:hypothetical protein